MTFIKWLLSIFIFLFICVLFVRFGNLALNTILLISITVFGIEVLIQKYKKHY